jgi:hypothetical protein
MSFGGIVALLRAAFLFLTATQLSPNVQSFRGNAISVAEPLINGTTSVPASSSAPNSIQNTITTSGPGTIASISYLSPSSGHAGTVVTIHGTGITATGNTVEFASADRRGLADMRSLNSSDGATLTFTVPATLTYSTCAGPAHCPPNSGASTYDRTLTSGTYFVHFWNSNAASHTVPFTVLP